MSEQSNKEFVRRASEAIFNNWDPALIEEYYAPDFVNHSAAPGDDTSREGLRTFFTALKAAFPDEHATTDDLIAEGDKVATRVTWSGTQTGEYLGVAPTGKRMTW